MLRWLTSTGGPYDRFHQAVVLQSPQSLDHQSLESAVDALLDHHDMLRVKLTISGDVLVLPPAACIAADSIIQTSPGTNLDDAFASIALDPFEGEIFRVIVLPNSGNAEGRILLVAHHIAVDAVSWPILTQDLAEAYRMAAVSYTHLTLPTNREV